MLIYHVDRLTRRPIELEQFLDVLTAAKVRHVRFVAGGDLDVGNERQAVADPDPARAAGVGSDRRPT